MATKISLCWQDIESSAASITIASAGTTGSGVIDTDKDDVTTGDILRIDIDGASTTAPKGLIVNIEFTH